MTLRIAVISDLYKAGVTEDGQDFVADRFYVMVEAPNGQRWVHGASFDSTKQEFDDEDGFPYFPDFRIEAKEKAEALADKVRAYVTAKGLLDLDHWHEVDPAYGSDAYQEKDSWGYFKQREISSAA